MSETDFVFDVSVPNCVLLNPQMPDSEKDDLRELQAYFNRHNKSTGHYLVASSGSSKKSDESVKLIALSVQSLLNSASRVNSYISSDKKDIWGLVLPTFHVAGLGIRARGHLSGAKVIESNWDKEKFCIWLKENKVTLTSLVPAQIYDLCSSKQVCPSMLRAVFVGAGSLQKNIKAQMQNLGWPLLECYGMTETSSMVAIRKKDDLFYQLMDGVNADLDERQCLAISCDSLLSASLQKVKDEVVMQIFSESHFQTDDRARFQFDGNQKYIELLGRVGDYVKINGEGVSLAELKSRLDEVSVGFGLPTQSVELLLVPDERSGHKVILAYEKFAGRTVFELMKRFNQHCRPYEKIHQAVAVEHFPRTELAKLKKAELKAIIEATLKGG